jgi:hypothetical protein
MKRCLSITEVRHRQTRKTIFSTQQEVTRKDVVVAEIFPKEQKKLQDFSPVLI